MLHQLTWVFLLLSNIASALLSQLLGQKEYKARASIQALQTDNENTIEK